MHTPEPEDEEKKRNLEKLQATRDSAKQPADDPADTSRLTDDTQTDSGSRSAGIAGRDTGAGDPYSGAPTGV